MATKSSSPLSITTPTLTRREDAVISPKRLKKREIDRRCQRQARERTKSRIAHLESLVENLQEQDADERSTALMKRLAETERERDNLAQTLKDIQKALYTHDASDEKDDSPEEQDKTVTIKVDEDAEDANTFLGSRSNSNSQSLSNGLYQKPTETTDARTVQNETVSEPEQLVAVDVTLPMVCNDFCDCCREARMGPTGVSGNLWRHANNTLTTSYAHSPITPEEDCSDMHIPVRVVIEGWDAVDQDIGLPLSWQVLRKIDESLFSACPPTERLAVLRTMHLLLQYHRDPSEARKAKLPAWFLKRPSQTKPHAYAINYFVWPGLRERFVFEQHNYCSNLFWQLFTNCLTISWPYDFRDCFAQRWDTGLFEISPLFQDCIGDISRWTMKPDIFNTFPALRCDIPVSMLTPRPVSNTMQLQMAQMVTRSDQQSSATFASHKNTFFMNHTHKSTPMSVGTGWMSTPAMMPYVDANAGFVSSYLDHPTSQWIT